MIPLTSNHPGLDLAAGSPGSESPKQIGDRLAHYDDNGLAAYIEHAKYTCYRADLGRWETWREAVDRVEAMHRTVFGDRLLHRIGAGVAVTAADPHDYRLVLRELAGTTLEQALTQAFMAVAEKRVLPAMRSLQFGGDAILRNHARLFNCAFSPVDRVEFFREYFFLLLSGTGCGFSVQRQHVEQLPSIPAPPNKEELPLRSHRIADSIEGWADALHVLLRSHFDGFTVRFDYVDVRRRGEPLRTAGGVASGPEPLRRALSDVDAILKRAAGRRLRPIEVYDVCMFVSRAVLGGGTRRAASICLFSADDEEMMNAKNGPWVSENPQRAACNNSAVMFHATLDETQFGRVFEAQKQFGEPGFYFTDDADYGCNPCGEAGLHPVLPQPLEQEDIERLRAYGYTGDVSPNARLSGWQMCNLTTINGAIVRDADELFLACVHATVIGTLQAAYTDIRYLGPVTRAINERDALLGVSICGFMDNPRILFDPEILERGAEICRATNQLVASALGIRPAARVTCVKPEGTASLVLAASAGIHPHPARRYFRRVQADRRDSVYQQFRAVNAHMTERSLVRPANDDVIVFPVEAPAGAVVRDQLSAVEFLARVLLVQRFWVLPGETPGGRSPGLHHNVSHTCAVRADEWPAVADFIWQHRAEFMGVTLLGDDATRRYAQPPLQTVVTEGDVARWNQLRYQPVHYAASKPDSANHESIDTEACVTGACEG